MNETIRRLTKNSFVLSAGTIVTRLVNFLVTIYIARRLAVADFGQFSYAYTIFFAFAFFINLGLDNLVVRETARHPQEVTPFLSNIMSIRLIGWPFGFLLVGLLWLEAPASLWVMLLFFGYSLGSAHILLVSAVFRGLEKMGVQAFLLSLQAVFMAIGVLLVLTWTDDVVVVAAMYCLAALVVSWIATHLLHREGIRPKVRWQPDVWRQLFVLNLPFTVAFVSFLLFERLIVVFLSLFTDKTAVAWFNASFFIFLALFNVPIILVSILFPTLSRTALSQNRRHLEALYTTIFTFLWVICLPLTVVVIYLAPLLIELTFGSLYAQSTLILQILVVGLPFICVVILLGSVLQTIDAQGVAAKAYAGGLLITLPLVAVISWQFHNYVLSTISYTMGTMLLAGLMWVLTWTEIRLKETVKTIFLPVTAVFGMIIILLFVPLELYWTLPLSLLWYAAFLLFSGVLSKDMIFVLKASPVENHGD